MKRMKKVLSIVLSLAMILTSITVYNTKTAKADEGDIAEVVFTAQTKLVKENTQIEAYDENGTLIVDDEDDVTSVDNCVKYYSANKYLHFESDGKESKVLENDGPRVTWETVENAEKYIITATDDTTGKVLKTWEKGKTDTAHHFSNSDIQNGNAGTYTLTITAYDASNNAIIPEEYDTCQIKNCKKYYKDVTPDRKEDNVEQTDYTKAGEITDWKQLDGRTIGT
jgi:hypothetical protein